MLDQKDCEKIKKELDELSRGKIELMKQSREIVKTSKKLIYALHRRDYEESDIIISDIEGDRTKLDKLASTEKLRQYHPYINGLQEYVEAVAYWNVVRKIRIPSHEEFKVDAETYLMGLSDLTGELMRKAVNDMVDEDYESPKKLRDIVDDIYGLILSLDLDGGEARRKSDQVKWNLNKMEGLIYDAKIRDKI